MIAVVQRVKSASVKVDGEIKSAVLQGLLVYLGIIEDDEEKDLEYIVKKITQLRIFSDTEGKMNKSVADINGQILVVSQFTLAGDVRKGNRPSFIKAMKPPGADKMYQKCADLISQKGITVSTGVFGAMMDVASVNDGPVTILLDSKKKF